MTEKDVNDKNVRSAENAERNSTGAESAEKPLQPRVVIVDDDPYSRKRMRAAAEKAGCNVTAELSDGDQALKFIDLFHPDVILMDLVMKRMDGLSATRRILSKKPDAKIIIVSSLGKPGIIDSCIAAGARDFVAKPFTDEILMAALTLTLAAADKGGLASQTPANESGGPAEEMKILIVDDDHYMRKKLKELVESLLAAKIFEAADGAEAIRAVEWLKPQIVLMDIMMKDVSGVNALARVRELSPDSHIIMVSSMTNPQVIAACLENGAAGYITKPFTKEDLVSSINKLPL